MIISHKHRKYNVKWQRCKKNKFNGAYYYSREIVKNIIPLVETDRNWITVNLRGEGADHSIVFVHNNKCPENYDWLSGYKDLVLVCGVPETCEKLKHLGRTIYLPLSIDVEEVKQYEVEEKDKEVCFAGRPAKRSGMYLPGGIDYLEGMPRSRFLAELARYKKVYAVGRTAVEAKALGAKIMQYDPRYPDTNMWLVLDNKDAAKILQEELDKIDRPEKVKAEEPETKEPEIISSKAQDLNVMTKAQLVNFAEALGLEINKKAKKSDMIKEIEDARR